MEFVILNVIIFFFFTEISWTAGQGCRPGYDSVAGGCFLMVTQKMNQAAAQAHCQALTSGGHLAKIVSDVQHRALAQMQTALQGGDCDTKWWMGLVKDDTSGASMRWVGGDGAPLLPGDFAPMWGQFPGQGLCIAHVTWTSPASWQDNGCQWEMCSICSYTEFGDGQMYARQAAGGSDARAVSGAEVLESVAAAGSRVECAALCSRSAANCTGFNYVEATSSCDLLHFVSPPALVPDPGTVFFQLRP